ncbi:MAG TPA: NAD(P)H-dependent oxidoreductase [Nevskiaceae bacterium]|nr:NAD(P)H-dependent oxidoreductase [Nevskiaceae bacterium]
MPSRILIVQGHPDPEPGHFGVALANAYADGAREAAHDVRVLEIGRLDFPILRSKREWEDSAPVECIRRAQADIQWSQHLVFCYPLWLGAMPALLKGFLEQIARPGFAVPARDDREHRKLLHGRSARIVVTMGMPALVYRWYFGAHSLKSLERNVLGFCGIGPIRESLVGMVENLSPSKRQQWLQRLRRCGRQAR